MNRVCHGIQQGGQDANHVSFEYRSHVTATLTGFVVPWLIRACYNLYGMHPVVTNNE
jgi:hypothetical protein